MKIREIYIHGFGKMRDFSLTTLSPTITIFEGDNEAGKSTVMTFIRSILFGFPANRSQENRYEPIDGGAYGGSIVLEEEQGTIYRIERLGGGKGKTSVYLEDGTAVNEFHLDRLRGGLSESVFRDIFAFSLTELQQLKTLQSEEINSYLYGAGMGIGGVSIFDVERKLLHQKEELFKPKGSNPSINKTLKTLDGLEIEIKRLQEENGTYNDLRKQLEQLTAAIKDNEAKTKAFEEQLRLYHIAERSFEQWKELSRLKEEQNLRMVVTTFPEQGVLRLEQLEKEKRELQALMKDYEQEGIKLEEQLQRLTLHEDDTKRLQMKDRVDQVISLIPIMRKKIE